MQTSVHRESKIHQLSPYVGKLKSEIARDLILEFSDESDLVVDPFSGSGTVPLEALLNNRCSFSADLSPYSKALTLGKLTAPSTQEVGITRAKRLIENSNQYPLPDLRSVPLWVRRFFHNQTLKETIRFIEYCKSKSEYFYLACMLGILHHQRPGFLSYPSSHLTPYLRDRKYPKAQFPEMYEYRDFRPRLIKKVTRSLSLNEIFPLASKVKDISKFRKSSIFGLTWPSRFDLILTSPPYMNALDYGRDNRLRIWFLNSDDGTEVDSRNITKKATFVSAIQLLGERASEGLKNEGKLIIIIGETVNKGRQVSTSSIAQDILKGYKHIQLVDIRDKPIPDLRRARRNCKAVTNEQILIFEKNGK